MGSATMAAVSMAMISWSTSSPGKHTYTSLLICRGLLIHHPACTSDVPDILCMCLQVVDEADTMFAEGWGAELGQILTPLRNKPDPARVLLVSATMTKVGAGAGQVAVMR